MSKIAFAFAAAVAAFALAGASAAAAAADAAIDVPAQVFPQGQASSQDGAKPVVTSQWRPLASIREDRPIAGRNFGVNLPILGAGGAGGRLPLTLHVLSSEEECHDDADVNGAAQRQDQDFIRGGEH